MPNEENRLVEAIIDNQQPIVQKVEFFANPEEVEDAMELEELLNDWLMEAKDVVVNGGIVPDAPIDGDHNIFLDDGRHFVWNNERGLTFVNNNPQPLINVRVRRGNRAILDGDRHMPAGIEPIQPNGRRWPPPPLIRGNKQRPFKQKIYPPNGVMFKGFIFSRELEPHERTLLSAFGYHALLLKVPDLVYVEKEIPIDEKEECVILISELADHLAVQACKKHIPDFSVETHTSEYQSVYKRYLKEISQFKRTTNG